MSFKRNDVQEFIEFELGCVNKESWGDFKDNLLDWRVDENNITKLKRSMDSDICSYFLKGLQTFVQAVHEINEHKYAWSIVKLYYSTFYLLRCDVLLSNHIMVRCKGMFFAKVAENEAPIPFRTRKGNGDHQITIALAKKLSTQYLINDPIFGNDIDDNDAYTWLMKNRERANYQMKTYSDPYPDVSFVHISEYFKNGTLADLFSFYNESEDYSICFDESHSMLSIPYKKLIQIYNKIESKNGFSFDMTDKRKIISSFQLLKDLNINKSSFFHNQ